MKINSYLDINDIEGQLIKGTWSGWVFTSEGGMSYSTKEGIRGWITGLFFVKDGNLIEVPEYKIPQLFKEHFIDVLQEVFDDANIKNISAYAAILRVERKWYDKWLKEKE